MDQQQPHKKLSLNQLKKPAEAPELPKGVKQVPTKDNYKPLSMEELREMIPKRERDMGDESFLKQQYDELDKAIERFKKEQDEFVAMVEAEELYDDANDEEVLVTNEPVQISHTKVEDDFLEDESEQLKVYEKLEDKMEEEVKETPVVVKLTTEENKDESVLQNHPADPTVTVAKEESKVVKIPNEDVDNSPVFIDDEEFEDEDDILDNVNRESERKERLSHIRSVVKKAYDSNMDKVDLSKFTISKKPVAINKIPQTSTPIITADWVLHSSQSCISASSLSGPEIEMLNVRGSNRGLYNAYRDMFSVLYNHTENKEKGSFEEWLRTISIYDLEDLYFAFYRACFGKDNQILYACDKCKNTYMTAKPIEDMSEFKSEEVKAKCKAIMDKGPGAFSKYEARLEQITNDYAVAIRVPSIYDAILAPILLPDDFREKYSDLIATCTFVDAIYYIDREHNTITPISTNPVYDNEVKTIKNKLKTFNKIFKTFTSKEYSRLKGIIANLGEEATEIDYYIPADICPKCGKEIPKEKMDPLQMLFTYHQLGQSAYISVE